MPFIGLSLHVLIALFFAVHAIRSGQQMYWLIVLFSFPLLGSLVYFLSIYLPNSRLEYGARQAVAAAARAIDPERALREARAAFEDTPTAQNQMRLAAALLERDLPEEAAKNYAACLKGPFAKDAEIRFGAARAFVECQRYPEAVEHLEAIRAADPQYRPEALSLLLARALAGEGMAEEARNEFEQALARFGSFEALTEYAIWAALSGDTATADRLQTEIDRLSKRWTPHTRALYAPILRRLEAAREVARHR